MARFSIDEIMEATRRIVLTDEFGAHVVSHRDMVDRWIRDSYAGETLNEWLDRRTHVAGDDPFAPKPRYS